jgi:hypothetical protein
MIEHNEAFSMVEGFYADGGVVDAEKPEMRAGSKQATPQVRISLQGAFPGKKGGDWPRNRSAARRRALPRPALSGPAARETALSLLESLEPSGLVTRGRWA